VAGTAPCQAGSSCRRHTLPLPQHRPCGARRPDAARRLQRGYLLTELSSLTDAKARTAGKDLREDDRQHEALGPYKVLALLASLDEPRERMLMVLSGQKSAGAYLTVAPRFTYGWRTRTEARAAALIRLGLPHACMEAVGGADKLGRYALRKNGAGRNAMHGAQTLSLPGCRGARAVPRLWRFVRRFVAPSSLLPAEPAALPRGAARLHCPPCCRLPSALSCCCPSGSSRAVLLPMPCCCPPSVLMPPVLLPSVLCVRPRAPVSLRAMPCDVRPVCCPAPVPAGRARVVSTGRVSAPGPSSGRVRPDAAGFTGLESSWAGTLSGRARVGGYVARVVVVPFNWNAQNKACITRIIDHDDRGGCRCGGGHSGAGSARQ
jgi:hypothetical protein